MEYTFYKLKNIIKSRFIKDKNLPSWHKERKKICGGCSYNFKNQPLHKRKPIDYYWYFLNGFNTHCTICKCGIKFKTRIKDEYCALENIGQKPKWDEVNE